jgi:uncharacterized protein YdaU (DUF1376 family)
VAPKTDIWMPWYVTDYMRDTGEMTVEEDCFYRRALDQCWIRRGGIPTEAARLCALLRFTPGQFKRCKWILERFFYKCEDGYRNSRLDLELVKASVRKEIAAENGRRGGRPKNPEHNQNETRKEPSGLAKGKAKPNPEESSSPSPSKAFPSEKPPLPPKGGVSAWAVFKEPIERLFGKATSIATEQKQIRLIGELSALNATPEELEDRVSRYRQFWPDIACTLQGVVNNWNQIPTKGSANGTNFKSRGEKLDAGAEELLRDLRGTGQGNRDAASPHGSFSEPRAALPRSSFPARG